MKDEQRPGPNLMNDIPAPETPQPQGTYNNNAAGNRDQILMQTPKRKLSPDQDTP